MLAELRAELRLHTKEIVALQADFVRLFPFDKLTRLKADELKIALAELSSKSMARFVGLLALLLYCPHRAEGEGRGGGGRRRARHGVGRPARRALLRDAGALGALRARMMKRRALVLTVLPLLLLSTRVCVEALFRQAFPKWWTTVDARDTLQTIDAAIETMLDPDKYHSHISSLESSTEAIRIAARDELGVKYRAREARFYSTSTMVRAALRARRSSTRTAASAAPGCRPPRRRSRRTARRRRSYCRCCCSAPRMMPPPTTTPRRRRRRRPPPPHSRRAAPRAPGSYEDSWRSRANIFKILL